jgi:predicted transposase YbfD/YdcC
LPRDRLARYGTALSQGARVSSLGQDRHGPNRHRTRGKRERQKRYYISSVRLDAKLLANAVRPLWGIENRLHWVLDIVFQDHLARLRTGFEPQNMAVVKNIAMNLIRQPKDRHRLKNRRKLACLNSDYLEAVLRAPAALT